MEVNRFVFRLLSCLLLLCFSMVGCTTRISLSTSTKTFYKRPIDLDELGARYSQVCSGNPSPAAIACYNQTAEDAITRLIKPLKPGELAGVLKTTDGDVDVIVDHRQIRSFDRIDRIRLASTIEVTNGLERTHSLSGVGVPLLARIAKTKEDPMLPVDGTWIPITATIEPCDGNAKVKLLDPLSPCCQCQFPIASDITASLARDLYTRQKDFKSVRAMVNYDRFAPYMGLNRIFDFHPDKTPVVLVHGMLANATTWSNTINDLMVDPEIRRNFEFWIFGYPTGAPIPFLSHRLREDVAKMHSFRQKQGARCNDIIVMGHSMGGLMAKTLTQQSGQQQWQRFFEVSPDQLSVNAEERKALRDMFFFEPLPGVKQVIFLATPHRGAESAGRNYSKFGDMLIRRPELIAMATRNVLHQSIHALTPLGIELNHEFPNSIEQMRYGSELGTIFADIPLSPCVKYHSIIGSEFGLDVPKEQMTDGVLTYASAHIDGVPETIVHSEHGVHRDEDGIAEIIRLLKSAR